MPTVGNLDRLRACTRYGMTVARAAIASDDADTRMAREPRLDGLRMPVRQEINDATTLQVANYGAITLAPLPCEVIDADDGGTGWLHRCAATDQSEQCVTAHWQCEATGGPRTGRTAECQADMPLDVRKPTASTSLSGCDIWKPFDEDLALATSVIATEAPKSDRDHYGTTLPWKIGDLAIVSAVDPV